MQWRSQVTCLAGWDEVSRTHGKGTGAPTLPVGCPTFQAVATSAPSWSPPRTAILVLASTSLLHPHLTVLPFSQCSGAFCRADSLKPTQQSTMADSDREMADKQREMHAALQPCTCPWVCKHHLTSWLQAERPAYCTALGGTNQAVPCPLHPTPSLVQGQSLPARPCMPPSPVR